MTTRQTFGGRFAVIMAMAGSAIGLGNLWRFPYMVGQNGGAAFIIIYLLACFMLALPIFFSESIIGRRSRRGNYGAFQVLAPESKWRFIGLLTVISPILLLSYYSVVGGWSVDFLSRSLSLDFTTSSGEEVEGFFGDLVSSPVRPIAAHATFLLMTAAIVLLGVKRGIERFTKITMPLLFVLIVVIAVYSLTLPGSSGGVEYLLRPVFSKVGAGTVAAAMGQAFFSMSLGVGTVLTYSSYVSKDENILASGAGTAISDLLFAVLAGFAIMPAVFSAGIEPGSGPGLLFETLPYIFNQMGEEAPLLSAAVSIMFFFTVMVAAVTSAISMMEVGVAYLTEELHISRAWAVLSIFLFALVVGALCSLSFGSLSGVKLLGCSIFDFFDKVCSNWLLPLGGLMFTIFVGWRMRREDVYDEFTNGGTLRGARKAFPAVWFLMRYFAPIGIAVVFVTSLL